MDEVLIALPFYSLANPTANATRHRPSGVPPSGSIPSERAYARLSTAA